MITKGDKIGFVNERGKTVIEPVYLSGNEFAEGLAAVRQGGLYGFIDSTGYFVIKPQYDFATSFLNGLALVYRYGTPIFINKKNEQVFDTVYRSLQFIIPSKGIIVTRSGKSGLIDIGNGKLIADTLYSTIGEFHDGLAIVTKTTKARGREENLGVIDTAGNLLVPFGKYKSIKAFNEGYASVEILDKSNTDGNADGLIDKKGRLLFQKRYNGMAYISGEFHSGLAVMDFKKGGKGFQGYIDTNGRIVLDDSNFNYANDFSGNRAFIQRKGQEYTIINSSFKQVGSGEYSDVQKDGFQNGYAIVESGGKWGVIDTTGNYLVPAQFDGIDKAGVIDSVFFYSAENPDGTNFYGIADIRNNIILKPIMQEFNTAGFVNGMLRSLVDGKLTLINKLGTIIWQENKDTLLHLKALDIDYMNRAYCHAYATLSNNSNFNSGGWGTSENFPVKITQNEFAKHQLSLVIATGRPDTFAHAYTGISLFLANTSKDTISFKAQDSRLYLTMEALNTYGQWAPIEYAPSSWCGNSYHTLQLEPDHYWRFVVPDYKGSFKTKLRAVVKYVNPKKNKEQLLLYSNIIEGSVNPGQFWNRRTYYPGGIMDPYNN